MQYVPRHSGHHATQNTSGHLFVVFANLTTEANFAFTFLHD